MGHRAKGETVLADPAEELEGVRFLQRKGLEGDRDAASGEGDLVQPGGGDDPEIVRQALLIGQLPQLGV
ncbi:MAG: hypothetical protein IJS01_09115 [Lentisphaeria bacterium]|nr:hypothetical protein [Lentisphaeria bacterium]